MGIIPPVDTHDLGQGAITFICLLYFVLYFYGLLQSEVDIHGYKGHGHIGFSVTSMNCSFFLFGRIIVQHVLKMVHKFDLMILIYSTAGFEVCLGSMSCWKLQVDFL